MKRCLNRLIGSFIFLLLFTIQLKAQQTILVIDSIHFKYGTEINLSNISFRGLSVVDDKVIWVSGSKGTIAKSNDGGNTFTFMQLKGYEKSDFRDIESL